MSEGEQANTRSRRTWLAPVLLVTLAALIMGLPTVRGGFVGGDDHRLVIDHVFVNHPSFSHAWKLFSENSHRDLYQPVPLLTYQLEFAIAQALGLFDVGPEGGGWLFHSTNIVLHAINAALVWAVVAMLCSRLSPSAGPASPGVAGEGTARSQTRAAYAIATVAALLFAVHPLQTEVIAWLNGRMMLLSTLFAMASLLALASWLDRPRWSVAILTVVFVLLCTVSKVRVGLPVLLLIVVVARRAKPTWRLICLWSICTVVTAIFVWVNIKTTAQADLFAQGGEHLRGPRAVRVLLAVAWYFQHIVWPVGLASYYPTPPFVSWADTETWRAIAIVVVSFAVLGLACWRSRAAQLGTVWYFATLASTLPIVPARNILAADRYMYLPIIGLFWIAATIAVAGYRRMLTHLSRAARLAVVVAATVALLVPSILMGWHVASFYETPLEKTKRIVDLFPDAPRVWEPRGRTLLSEGHIDEAIAAAKMELRHDVPNIRSGAYQLLGKCELARGNTEAGIEYLHRALDEHPESGIARFELGKTLIELGRLDEALGYLEEAARMAPLHNPTINRLASAYRRLGRPDDARKLYEQAVRNNKYEYGAVMGLAELDIKEGTREAFRSAERRLLDLLDWMPENSAAWTNLGVVRSALGRQADAIAAYQRALNTDPGNVTALVNIAQLYQAGGDFSRAHEHFDRAASVGVMPFAEALTVHDFLLSQRRSRRAVQLWETMDRSSPDSERVRAMLALSLALTGSFDTAAEVADTIPADARTAPWPLAMLVYLDLVQERYLSASDRTLELCELGEGGALARAHLLRTLEYFDRQKPGISWTFCLAGQLLLTSGNIEAAGASVKLCEERCKDEACHQHVQTLKMRINGTDGGVP